MIVMKFDIIGDIHGCYDELIQLLQKLGYKMDGKTLKHPDGRKPAFVGDAMDRGPNSLRTMELMFNLQDADKLIYSPGNHCNKFYRYAKGNKVHLTHGIETTVAELDDFSLKARKNFIKRYIKFYEALPLYHTLNDGKLIIAHAGIREDLIGTNQINLLRSFVLYGDVTGERLPNGRPLRRDWARNYRGDPFIVYGHTPVEDARFINNTVNIDTGCIFGGKLTALRYPEKEIVSVPSKQLLIPDRFTSFT